MVGDATDAALICFGGLSMHRELHAILFGLLVIVLASVAILFAVKKKASLETRYAFISANTGVPAR
jgi:hypothetical protein